MSACYSVRIKVKLKDEKSAVRKINGYMKERNDADYAVKRYAESGIGTDSFDSLMKIFLAKLQSGYFHIEKENGFTVYTNDFNASYGWEDIITGMFYEITPFLEDESELCMSIDNYCAEYVIQNGECIQER